VKFLVLISLFMGSFAFAGNTGSGMRHDDHMAHHRAQLRQIDDMHRIQQEQTRRIMAEEAHRQMERQRAEEAARVQAERQAAIEAERIRVEEEAARVRREQEAQQASLRAQQQQLEQRRRDLETQRANGNLNMSQVTESDLLDMFQNDPSVQNKEYWASMIIVLGSQNPTTITAARDFLILRGWSQTEIDGLNVQSH